MTRGEPGRPSSCPCSRSSLSPKAWKVRIADSAWPYGTSRSTRACISAAAFSVKVSARISRGRARLVAMSHAMRRVMTSVLPVPGPATTSSGPRLWVTARRWSRSRPLSSGRTTSRSTGAATRPGTTRRVGGCDPCGRLAFMTRSVPGPCATYAVTSTPAWRKRLRLLGGEGHVASPRDDGAQVDPRAGPRVQAGQQDPVGVAVQQRHHEALVAARLLERVEAHDAHALDHVARIRLDEPQPAGLGHHLVTDPVEALHLRGQQLVDDRVGSEWRDGLAGASTSAAGREPRARPATAPRR